MAGQPTVFENLVIIFAPRDKDEAKTVVNFLYASWRFAAGFETQIIDNDRL